MQGFRAELGASSSGEDRESHLASQSDSCALVKGPRAGASCEDAGANSIFHTPYFPVSELLSRELFSINDGYVPGSRVRLSQPKGLPRLSQIGQQLAGA